MKKIISSLILVTLLFHSSLVTAQFDPDKVCRIENGRITFSLNPKWTAKEKKEISERFDLDSVLIAKAFKGETTIAIDGDTWTVSKQKSYMLELSKPFLTQSGGKIKRSGELFLLIDGWMKFQGSTTEEQDIYGVNDFEIPNTFIYNDKAWFYLSGNKAAKNVFISGSFNKWSTNQNQMNMANAGWSVYLNLKPGKYLYKYILDGKWIHDPNNKRREKDGAGGYNSVVYCPNHLFELKGYNDAKKVVVTGNFCNWNPRGLALKKIAGGWSLPIYLREGTYAYKFVVDNQWITDPANKDVRKDGSGNLNSFVSIGEPYLFKLYGFPQAKSVVLTGSFNNWNRGEILMQRTDFGWQIPYVIPAGNYEYKFIVDEKWITDPRNPFSTGTGNLENSFIALKANHLFELDNYQDAKNVIVTGSFNGWKPTGYRMKKENGKWIFPIFLKAGKHTYKFIVDGNWIIDPANDLFEQNEYNTNNSVLWIDP